MLSRAIESVLRQTVRSQLELIVVDDASDDSTPELLGQYSEKSGIIVICNPEPRGAAASRNIAAKRASGEFITGIDDDDHFEPERVELLMRAFSEHICGTCSFDRMKYGRKHRIWKKKRMILPDDLLYYNQVGNQLLTRRDYFLEVGGFDETLSSAQDYDLWIRLSERFGPVRTVPRILQTVEMGENPSRISHSRNKMSGYLSCFEKHRHRMNEVQIRYQEYRLALAVGNRPSWVELVRAVPLHLWKKEIIRKLFL